MQATDPDSSANLIYYMEGPKQAWDASGQDVPAGNYEVRGGDVKLVEEPSWMSRRFVTVECKLCN